MVNFQNTLLQDSSLFEHDLMLLSYDGAAMAKCLAFWVVGSAVGQVEAG